MAVSPKPASRHDHYKLTGVKVTDQVLGTGPYTIDIELEYMGLKCIGKKIHQALFMQGDATTKVRQLKEQCHLLSQLRHPNLAMFLGLFFQQSPILVIEFVPYSLTSCIEQYGLLPSEVTYSTLHDVALGLSNLHNRNPPIIHGELCANNVLLTSNMRAKVVYLGVAKILQLTQPEINYMAKTSGTSTYMSPEVITGTHQHQDCSTDIFSFGIMVNHILTGKLPKSELISETSKATTITVSFSDVERKRANDKGDTDHLVKELVFRCTNENPQLRPQAEELVRFFADMVTEFPSSFVNRLEMLKRFKAYKKLKLNEKDKRELEEKVKGMKQQVLTQQQTVDRLTIENELLKQQVKNDDELICKIAMDLQKSHAEQQQQNSDIIGNTQDLAQGTGETKLYGPKPKVFPRKKAPAKENHMNAFGSPQSSRIKTKIVNKSPMVPPRRRYTVDATISEMKEIQLVTSIGKGRFFEVWEGKWNETKRVAIKKMTEQFQPTEGLQDELATMKSFSHPNLVQFYSSSMRIGEPVCLIVELMEGGSLLDYLREAGETLQLSRLIEKAEQIAAGMAYLEQRNYVHQSLSARNVMLTKDLVCKVSDYGIIRLLKEVNKEGSIPMCLPKRTAPEAFLHGQFTIKSDVWSFGIVLYEIITYGHLPYLGMSNGQVMQKLQEGYRIPCPENCQEKLYEIMLSCWKQEPESRPTFETLRWQMEDYFSTDQEGYLFMKSKRLSIT